MGKNGNFALISIVKQLSKTPSLGVCQFILVRILLTILNNDVSS